MTGGPGARAALARTACSVVLALGTLAGCSDDGDRAALGDPVDPNSTASSATPLAEGEVWLYERLEGAAAAGDTGTRRDVVVEGRRSSHSTTYWVGCDSVPATADFALGKEFSTLRTTLMLDTVTPADLRVRVVLLADDVPRGAWTLTRSASVEVEVDGLEEVGSLHLAARALNPKECEESQVGYGIALDARLSRS